MVYLLLPSASPTVKEIVVVVVVVVGGGGGEEEVVKIKLRKRTVCY